MNKRGWIKIVEAFVAILLIAAVLLIVVDKTGIGKKDISQQIHDAELSILREIQLNNSLRGDMVGVVSPVVTWDDAEFPLMIKNRIIYRTPNYLDCKASICWMNITCELGEIIEADVYSESVTITANMTKLDYRQLKLFCWTK
ncbi:hypothetical protein KAJ87_00280 [Candidatus Pacearchaeota archaeon]|nr:hypothetical protein [Candidatus Pacearchaeota archaeon]